MASQISVLGLILSSYLYLRSGVVRFPLEMSEAYVNAPKLDGVCPIDNRRSTTLSNLFKGLNKKNVTGDM